MNKRFAGLLAGFSLAAGLTGFAWIGTTAAGAGPDRYPGSVALAGEAVHAQPARAGEIAWQSSYQTSDALPAVRRWYAARLNVSPASDMNPASGDCACRATQQKSPAIQNTSSLRALT